jgi:hypothetical protein
MIGGGAIYEYCEEGIIDTCYEAIIEICGGKSCSCLNSNIDCEYVYDGSGRIVVGFF